MFGIPLNQIASFTIDHTNLQPGLYLSRQDGQINTYDLRFKRPNKGDYLSPGTAHSIEHLAATYLRSGSYSRQIIYFGPMGCRTGFYLLAEASLAIAQLKGLLEDTFTFIKDFEGKIPGATIWECGNYLEMDLPAAKKEAAAYLQVLIACRAKSLDY